MVMWFVTRQAKRTCSALEIRYWTLQVTTTPSTLLPETVYSPLSGIADANRNLGSWRLEDCALFVTLEPCPMCAGAILNGGRFFVGLSGNVVGGEDDVSGLAYNLRYIFQHIELLYSIISAALAKDGVVEYAVVLDPYKNELFSARDDVSGLAYNLRYIFQHIELLYSIIDHSKFSHSSRLPISVPSGAEAERPFPRGDRGHR